LSCAAVFYDSSRRTAESAFRVGFFYGPVSNKNPSTTPKSFQKQTRKNMLAAPLFRWNWNWNFISIFPCFPKDFA